MRRVRMLRLLVVSLLLGIAPALRAQEYKRPPADVDRLVQELFAEMQSDQVPYEELYESLIQYYQTPLNLNTASREELRGLLLLSETQISALLDHRQRHGALLSLYELQTVTGFDLRSIYRVAPFVMVTPGGPASAQGTLWQRMRREDNNALFIRYGQVLQKARGYTAPDTTSTGRLTSRYTGSPDRLLVRYRVSHARDFSFGFTAEKDAGESWSWHPVARRYGADFYSAHWLVQERGRLKALVVGDYQLQFGQGLLLSSGLQVGKGAETITALRRSNVGIRPYSSVLENSFFRGSAATVALTKTLSATGFLSLKNVDASLRTAIDSAAAFDEYASGVLLTGYHRTPTELANRKVLRELISGGDVSYVGPEGRFSAGLTVVDTRFSKPLLRRSAAYNAFEFQGSHNTAVSAHYNYLINNTLIFGETARSKGGGFGTVNGMLVSLAPTVDGSVLYRRYTRDFHTFYGNAFGENSRNINESGLYIGLKIRPVVRWEVSAYHDQFWFPWLKYQVGAPSSGHDWLVRVAFSPSKTSLLYAQLRARVKDRNAHSNPVRPEPLPVPTAHQSVLVFYEVNPSSALSLRTRLQATTFREDHGPARHGYVLAQDASLALTPRLQLSARYALFDTDDYDTRQYVLEQDVLYAFSVPVLYGRGTRSYLLAQLKCSRHLTLWLRYDETLYRHQKTVGSGLEETQGPRRSELKAQVRYQF